MPKRKRRIILDTNLWISFLLTKDISRLDPFFSDASLLLLFSQELLEEFIEVAGRPKFKKYFALSDLQDLLRQIHSHAEFVEVKSSVVLSRDLKDNFLLSLALDGKAHFLITGDKDLLILKKVARTKIMTMSEFLTQHE
jgi:putative PIN family toxin of toxin-antitoxin system